MGRGEGRGGPSDDRRPRPASVEVQHGGEGGVRDRGARSTDARAQWAPRACGRFTHGDALATAQNGGVASACVVAAGAQDEQWRGRVVPGLAGAQARGHGAGARGREGEPARAPWRVPASALARHAGEEVRKGPTAHHPMLPGMTWGASGRARPWGGRPGVRACLGRVRAAGRGIGRARVAAAAHLGSIRIVETPAECRICGGLGLSPTISKKSVL